MRRAPPLHKLSALDRPNKVDHVWFTTPAWLHKKKKKKKLAHASKGTYSSSASPPGTGPSCMLSNAFYINSLYQFVCMLWKQMTTWNIHAVCR